jgi:peptidoglycan/xylan/chitin deacetylase (PgdA/CDA1 family)
VTDPITRQLHALRDWTYDHYHYAYIMGTGLLCQSVFEPSKKAAALSWLASLAVGAVLEPCVNPYRQIYGKSMWRLSPDHPEVALTFDDGPGPDTTALLDVLQEYRVQANFFCIGQQIEKHPDLLRRMAAEGHLVGNHTETHPNLMLCGPEQTRQQLERVQHRVEHICGFAPTFWRAPFGFRAPWTQRVADGLQLRAALWSINPRDFQDPGIDVIVQRTTEFLEAGVIVLLHDGLQQRQQTVEATRRLIPMLLEKHYQFVRLDEAHG